MRELVNDNQIAAGKQMPEQCDIGSIAADERHRVANAEKIGDLPLEQAMGGPLAADQSRGSNAGADFVDRRVRGRGNLRVTRQPQVVVMSEAD